MSDEPIDDANKPRRKKRRSASDDDEKSPRVRRTKSGGGEAVSTVIPYRNFPALAAYYTGLLGLIGCAVFAIGGLFGIEAIILGISGASGLCGIIPLGLGIFGFMIARKSAKAHGTAHAWVGIALGALEMLTGLGAVVFIVIHMFGGTR